MMAMSRRCLRLAGVLLVLNVAACTAAASRIKADGQATAQWPEQASFHYESAGTLHALEFNALAGSSPTSKTINVTLVDMDSSGQSQQARFQNYYFVFSDNMISKVFYHGSQAYPVTGVAGASQAAPPMPEGEWILDLKDQVVLRAQTGPDLNFGTIFYNLQTAIEAFHQPDLAPIQSLISDLKIAAAPMKVSTKLTEDQKNLVVYDFSYFNPEAVMASIPDGTNTYQINGLDRDYQLTTTKDQRDPSVLTLSVARSANGIREESYSVKIATPATGGVMMQHLLAWNDAGHSGKNAGFAAPFPINKMIWTFAYALQFVGSSDFRPLRENSDIAYLLRRSGVPELKNLAIAASIANLGDVILNSVAGTLGDVAAAAAPAVVEGAEDRPDDTVRERDGLASGVDNGADAGMKGHGR